MDYQDELFSKIKRSFKKMILNEIWDTVELSDLQYITVKAIVNADSYDSIANQFRIEFVDCVFKQVERKFKTKQREAKEYAKEREPRN